MDREIKNKLIMFLGGLGVTVGVYFIFKYIFPIVSPFVIAFLLAYAIEKPAVKLSRHFSKNKIISSSIIVVFIAIIILSIVAFISYKIFLETKSFISKYDYYMSMANIRMGDICSRMDHLFGIKNGDTLQFINSNWSEFEGKIQEKVIPAILDGSIPLIFKIVTIIAVFFIILMSVVYISKDFQRIREWKEHTMFASEVKAVADRLKALTRIYFRVQLMIMMCTAITCVLGLLLVKNPYAIILGIVIGILDALPMFGTGTVLIPWSIVMLITGRFFDAAVLFSAYLITYLIREFMESKYMGDRLGIAPFTMMVIIYMGLLVYGLWGFILGPVSYVIIKTMILYLKSQLEHGKLSKI